MCSGTYMEKPIGIDDIEYDNRQKKIIIKA